MIKITLIALGGLKEKYLKDAESEYKKRLSRYCNLEIIEIEPERINDNPSQSEIDTALKKEADRISAKIPKNCKIISLCVEGKQFSSPDFAKETKSFENFGENIAFIIGSSYGLSQKIKEMSDIKLSLSKMTFPHKLFRIMLLEQIYRAFKINEGSAYHK